MPQSLDQQQLLDSLAEATILIADENDRGGGVSDQGHLDKVKAGTVTALDLEGLKKRHSFLAEYSDSTLTSLPLETVLKLESTSIKLRNLEKSRATEEKLAANRDSLGNTVVQVQAGVDNRLSKIHAARFLPGMGCSAAKMWEEARKVLGSEGHAAIGTYDMKSVGLAGYVTPQGWGAIHDPGNSNISLRMFSINNCGRKIQGKVGDQEDNLFDVVEIGEFKVALRVLREAMSFVHPWNKSVAALEGFMMMTNFCAKDLEGLDRQAMLLTQFTDYVLRENSNRWRGLESFMGIDELKGAWESFFGARPQAMLAKTKNHSSRTSHQGNNFHGGLTQGPQGQQQRLQGGAGGGGGRGKIHPSLFYEDICVMWNIGRCTKAPGTCQTSNGKPLRHICNYRPDYTRAMPPCGANHASCFYH